MLRGLIVFLALSTNAFAWGPMGHKIVAQVALSNLNPKAISAVSDLLEKQSMMDVSIWADKVKNIKEWQHTKTWHFVSIEDNDTYENSTKDPAGDVIESIDMAIATLKDKKATKEDQQSSLKFLIHFVGDMHQPLHVGRAGDRGGNEIQINYNGRPCNLHAFWDTIMIDSQKMGITEYAASLESSLKSEQIDVNFNYSKIVAENMNLRDTIYGYESADIDQAYIKRNIPVLNNRMYVGGKRLANIINSIFN